MTENAQHPPLSGRFSQENYDAYCLTITTEFPGLIPSSYETWVAFNRVVDDFDNQRDPQLAPTKEQDVGRAN